MKTLVRTLAAFALAALSITAYAADGSSLKPPPGARVAIVMFEDLECPDCARAYPVVWETANSHKIPVVLHDFPLQMHPWSFDAAVYARYFDTKSEKLGNDFRGYIFSNQPQITKDNLRQYVDKFANENKSPLPFAVDPEGKLKDKILADRNLGTQMQLQHTPTIFVVGNGGAATPAVEVTDRSQLGQIVEDMLAKSPPAKAVTPSRNAAKPKKKAATNQ
ncbi:MAG TPA: thioredoxin domain-containing protein [Candidatus Angelobacter sp.]|nr:thioredoxin domain-containing protein [Candidatus Angelobacter sp.]